MNGILYLSTLALAVSCFADGPSRAPLADAAQRPDKSEVLSLLAKHSDVNAAQPDGTTALHWASYNDDLEIASALIRKTRAQIGGSRRVSGSSIPKTASQCKSGSTR